MSLRYGAQNILYDGENLSHYFDIVGMEISPILAGEMLETKVPGKPGNFFSSIEYGDREIILTMAIKGHDRTPLDNFKVWRKYASLLIKDEPKPMYFDETHYINVIANESSAITMFNRRGQSEVTFIAPDPYFYGKVHSIELKEGDNVFRVFGDRPTFPKITLTEIEDELLLANKTTGDRIKIPEVLTTEAKVVIDCERGRCTINGSYCPVDPSITDYFDLVSGKQYTINVSSGHGTLEYQERAL